MSYTKRYYEKLIAEYAKARDKAIIASLKADSVEPFKAFIEAWSKKGFMPSCFTLAKDEVLEISIRKMSLYCVNVPDELKERSVAWLLSRGYDLYLD